MSYSLDSMFEALSIVSEGSYVYLCDLEQDYSRWSKNAVEYFDLPGEYMYNAGEVWKEHIHPDDRDEYSRSIDEIFAGIAGSHSMMYRARTKEGNYVMCTCKGVVFKDETGQPRFFGGSIRNNTVLSYIDGITGLRSLYGLLEDISVMRNKKIPYTVLMLGMSHFTAINDMYGFSFGNNTLSSFGKLLKKRLGELGQLYKLDGTKYALISCKGTEARIVEAYREIREKAAHDFKVNGEKIMLSINGGIVRVNDFTLSRDTVLSCLKYTYYQSKNCKMGDLEIFTGEVADSNRQYLEMMNIIRSSVVNGCTGFFLCYQAIVNAHTDELKGMEALIRWQNDEYGVVSPNKFIPILEQDPVFPELGKLILRRAMQDSKRFIEVYPDFLIHVNISYVQLEQRDFIQELLDLINELEFPPENLCLELTERCRLLDIGLLKVLFRQLKEHGIKIALDDFGTGFSSIGIIRELDFDSIKVDREFVKNIDVSATDQKTIHFISNLADTFQAEVCVEGVENDSIRKVLNNYDVNSFQGYLYSKPITLEEFTKKYLDK